jgi:hypothetical protein
MAKAKAKAKTTPIEAPTPTPAPVVKNSSTKKTEIFRAPFETDVDLHIANFVAEQNISSYEVTEVIGHVEAADNYWQKTIKY